MKHTDWPGRLVAISTAIVTVWTLALLCVGCPDPRAAELEYERAAVNAVALATNAAIPLVAAAEERAGLDAVDASTDLADAQARLVRVRETFDGVWLALDAVAAAQNEAATELEAGRPVSLAPLRAAWCALDGALDWVGVAVAKSIGWGCP